MLKTLFNIPPQDKQKIAIIGAGAMGVSIASILARLGIADITIFEAESKPFNTKGSSINNTGILHHFVYGGHPNTLAQFFHQSLLFRKLMPDYVLGDSHVNYLVPNEIGNTAIYQDGVTFQDVADSLIQIYQNHLQDYPYDNFWGQPEDLIKTIHEDEMQSLLGEVSQSPTGNTWLANEKRDGIFAGALKVKQSVLNMGEYICHLINLIELLSAQKLVDIKYTKKVNYIDINNSGFQLKIDSSDSQDFDIVINAGYARGLGITIPSITAEEEKEGNLVKLKVYGLYKIPPSLHLKMPKLKETFSSTIMIRGQYGGIINVGYDCIAIFSGLEYNQHELHFPLDGFTRNLPIEWLENIEKITGRSEEDFLSSIKDDLSRWIPWVKELEAVKLKKAFQVYPGRKPANDLEAAQRDDNPVRYMYQHKSGGKYIHIPGFKLTSIPYYAFQTVLEILSIYTTRKILTQAEVNNHIYINNNSQIILSSEMEYALGKNLPQTDYSQRVKIIKEWEIY
ncbi:FAD-dependent oxidoreductase [Limnofasciculus baicalensis]|uniref:FAD-dependent oxidoreductase n=1 Tax=Limnofasciculus baicalensis BBK-W-15 TaxID=2699891 RepID=A0AAE3KQH6_9CYAN|nr:FAD-dependent oxidoreductase [Limnofasciculus baicalensis]MCP2727367.1 FAD-dependent oxidoreductase [Limnofasciculus baicalensis BBK-W-15]